MTKKSDQRPQIRISWKEFDKGSKDIIRQIRLFPGREYDQIICVSTGGLFVGGIVAKKLNIKNISIINAYKYREDNKSFNKVHISSDIPAVSESALLVDDIFDSGETMTIVLDTIKRKRMPEKVDTCCLYTKCSSIYPKPTYYYRTVDKWVKFPWED